MPNWWVLLTAVLPEGGEGGDAGDVTLVRAGGHVAQRLQLLLGAVLAYVAVEHGGCSRGLSKAGCGPRTTLNSLQ